MGIFGESLRRLKRETWGGGYTQMLAEEIYGILGSDDPIVFNQPVTFGRDTPISDRRSISNVVNNNPLTINTAVTNNGPVTYNSPVTYNAPVTYTSQVYYQSPDGPVNQNPYVPGDPNTPTPSEGGSVRIFVGQVLSGDEGSYEVVPFGSPLDEDFAEEVLIPGCDWKIPRGTIVSPVFSWSGVLYGATPPTMVYYGKIVSGGPNTYTMDLYLEGKTGDTVTITADVLVPSTQSIAPGPVLYPVVKYGQGSSAKYAVQHATWYART